MYLILFIFFIFIVYLLYELFSYKTLRLLPTFICTLLIVGIVLDPKLSISAAISGAKLFFNSVFPSIFPFLILINMIMGFGGIEFYSKILGNIICRPLKLPRESSIVILSSALCGYPIGAKYSCDLYTKGLIDFNTTERLINICSNASPIFILGTLGVAMLQDIRLGYLLLISHYISCIIMSFLLKPEKKPNYKIKAMSLKIKSKNMGEVLRSSVEDSINTTLMVGGFIVLFSVITEIIKNNAIFSIVFNNIPISSNLKDLFFTFFLGTLEMTNGCNLISTLDTPLLIKLCGLSFFISFSGFSIIAQVYSFTYKNNFSLIRYTLRKLLQGIVCTITTFVLYIPLDKLFLQSASSTINKGSFNPIPLYLLLVTLLLPLFIRNLKKLFFTS